MEKNSFKKKVTAIVSSILLLFVKSSSDLLDNHTDALKSAVIENQLNIDESKNLEEVSANYRDFKEIAEEIIPLNEVYDTSVGDSHCDLMTPQGMASFEDYLLVTAYDGIDGYKKELQFNSFRKEYSEKYKKEENHNPHNSVIYVIDKNDRNVLTTIELPDVNHVGGIAVDDKNAYIAKSSDKQISIISLDKIRNAINSSKESGVNYSSIDYDSNIDCECDASFISIRKRNNKPNQFVIGTWKALPSASDIRIFDMSEKGTLELKEHFKSNSSINGALFVERDDEEFFLVSTSIGKYLDSKLHVYKVQENEEGNISLIEKSKFVLPPMLEEIDEYVAEDGSRKLAIGTEIFSTRYEINRQKYYPKGIIIANLDKILDRQTQKQNRIAQSAINDISNDEPVRKREDDEIER